VHNKIIKLIVLSSFSRIMGCF